MSLLLDKKELKKAAKEITTVKLHEVIETLNAVLAERQKETEVLSQIRALAKAQGFTLEQLGYQLNADVVVSHDEEIESKGKR
ncbi:MAG: H-NS histone family protein, partial [Pararheinheimera sp.]|nr:H-NS histone family protein [Rheinheimera sp.]